MKCKVCGSEKFEFVSEEHVEKPDESTHDIGHYKCKRCTWTPEKLLP